MNNNNYLNNINKVFLDEYFNNDFKKIFIIINNTIELIKDENKFLKLCELNTEEGEVAILSSTLLFLGELKDVLSEDINYEELVHRYMIKCKEYIEKNIMYISTSLYNGLSDLGLAIYSVNVTTGNYNKIQSSVNKLIVERTLYNLNKIRTDSENIKMSDFDVMMGLSGVANYLLIFREEEYIRNTIIEIIKYFITLSDKILFNGYELPRYYIKNENQFTDFDKQLYKTGCINFSLSHGIAGPMIIMSKALKLGIEIPNQKKQ